MNKLTFAPVLLGFAAVASPALAHQGYDDDHDRRDYARSDYAQVLSSRPIVHQVAVSEPRQECWNEQVVYREPRYYQPTIGAGAILGGVIGGVIGHQFGGGHGRDVATAVGAVIGASAGAQQDAYAYGNYGAYRGYREAPERVGYEQRCRTVEDVRYQQQVDGYDVTYRYHGRIYRTRLPYDPGDRLVVNVDVRPATY